MRRREFIAGLGSAVVPLEARAQLGDRARRIGMLLPYDQNDPVAKTRVSAFMQALAELGWTDGHNVRMDLDWAGGDINRIRALAHELVALQPDIVVAGGTLTIAALQRETTTIPIVMTNVADPVGSGFVAAFNRPGGNITALFYGVDLVDIWRRAATYVDRILRGAKPAELPVQLPTKFEMAVNLKTAKALGLTVPPSIRLRADEVIE